MIDYDELSELFIVVFFSGELLVNRLANRLIAHHYIITYHIRFYLSFIRIYHLPKLDLSSHIFLSIIYYLILQHV